MAWACINNWRVVLGQKPKTLKYVIELGFKHHSIRLDKPIILVYSVVKIGYKMAELMPNQSRGKSGVLAYFGLIIGSFGHIFWDMDFKFVLPIIYINIIKGKTQL